MGDTNSRLCPQWPDRALPAAHPLPAGFSSSSGSPLSATCPRTARSVMPDDLEGFDYIRFTGYASMTNPETVGDDPTIPFGFGSPDRVVGMERVVEEEAPEYSSRDFPTRPFAVTYEVAV